MKSLKLNDYLVWDVSDFYDAILLNVESLESDGTVKPEHLGYSIRIFGDTSDSIFHL